MRRVFLTRYGSFKSGLRGADDWCVFEGTNGDSIGGPYKTIYIIASKPSEGGRKVNARLDQISLLRVYSLSLFALPRTKWFVWKRRGD